MTNKESIKESPQERIKKFHTHLDVCPQCENHPFNLCLKGVKLLKYAATGEKDDKSKPN